MPYHSKNAVIHYRNCLEGEDTLWNIHSSILAISIQYVYNIHATFITAFLQLPYNIYTTFIQHSLQHACNIHALLVQHSCNIHYSIFATSIQYLYNIHYKKQTKTTTTKFTTFLQLPYNICTIFMQHYVHITAYLQLHTISLQHSSSILTTFIQCLYNRHSHDIHFGIFATSIYNISTAFM